MILYLLKSAGCLALLLSFYHLVLEREKMHKFNRFFLLGSVLFSFLAPAFVIYVETIPQILETTPIVQEYYPIEFTTTEIPVEESFDYSILFIGIYILISGIFTVRFLFNLWKINKKINQNEKVKFENATLVLVNDDILPHSFWKSIFINKKDYKNNKLEPELLTHELTHVTQKHTIDILILELLQIVFWINPLFIFLKKAIQLNHEFLADNTVIKTHKNTFHYQHLLLNKAAWKNEYYLASNLNYSLTKKRLKMMTTQNSKTTVLLKKLAVIPVLAGFIFLFAERVEAQEKEEVIETIYEQEYSEKQDLSESEIYKEYFYKDILLMIKDKNGKKISKKYDELNAEEKARLIPPPPLNPEKKVPTKKLIEDLKDNSKYAIWIDGKVMKNSVLDNYKNTDFSNHSVSFVYKNARSKRFPQNYQASLYTNAYFKNENKKNKEKFLEYMKKEFQIEEIIEEKPKKRHIDSPIQSKKSSKQSVSDIHLKLKIIDKLIIKVNNPLDVYNKKNKYYEEDRNKTPHFVESSEKRQNSLTDSFSELGSLYFKLTKEDKRKAKRPIHPHHPYLKLTKIDGSIYYKLRKYLTEEDKLNIPPPPPIQNANEEEVVKAKKAYSDWKKRIGNDTLPTPKLKEVEIIEIVEDLPPPPPPISPLDYVIKMAKKDATFYYEGKKITSDKAIALLKENKNLNIETNKVKDSKTSKVWITKAPIIIEKKE